MPTANIKTSKNRTSVPPSTPPESDKQVYPSLRQFSGGSIRRYTFKYPPTNVQYDSLSPEWSEVERPGLVPLVGLRQYKLMRIQFEFLVSNQFDGILYPIDDDLIEIRKIANEAAPVYFQAMDLFLNSALNLPGTNRENASGAFFRIVDFSVNSIRRNTDNRVTAAQCSMAMQEDYNLAIKAVSMPAIEYPPILKPRVPKAKADTLCGSKSIADCQRDVVTSIIAGAGAVSGGILGF